MRDDSAMRARWSDAWILAAVDWAGDADLAKIIAAADAINHAIPTIEEAEHAIKFLGAAGLVRYADNSLQLTDEEDAYVSGLRRRTSSPPSTVYMRS
jgi:hypothetical protein